MATEPQKKNLNERVTELEAALSQLLRDAEPPRTAPAAAMPWDAAGVYTLDWWLEVLWYACIGFLLGTILRIMMSVAFG